jgi:hypothetical protein
VTTTEEDARWDEFVGQLQQDFELERLQSYYLTHCDDLLDPPREALKRAKSLLSVDPTASFVFAVSAVEILVRCVLLRRMLLGLVHEQIADIISGKLLEQTGALRHQDLLATMLSEFAKFDIRKYTRKGARKKLLEELKAIQVVRNEVIHSASTTSKREADFAICIAEDLVSEVVPRVLEAIRLQILPDGKIAQPSLSEEAIERAMAAAKFR